VGFIEISKVQTEYVGTAQTSQSEIEVRMAV